MKEKTDIVAKIREGDEKVIMGLYRDYREEFVNWAKRKFQLSQEESLDIFQDIVIGFYRDIKKEKLTHLEYSVKTYLFAMGKNRIFNKLRFDKKFSDNPDAMNHMITPDHPGQPVELTERKEIMLQKLSELGEPCQTILKLYYFDSFSMESIALRIGYKSADVVKSQKVRCMQDLKKRILSVFKKEDI